MKTTKKNHPLNEEEFSKDKKENESKDHLKEVEQDKELQPESDKPEETEQSTQDSPAVADPKEEKNESKDHLEEVEQDSSAADESKEEKSEIKEKQEVKSSEEIGFVDDEEEKLNNDVFDGSVEHPGNDSGGDKQGSEKKNEEETINYELLTKEDIVKIFSDKLKSQDVEKLKYEVERITEAFQKKHDNELEEKKERFLKEGGNIEDFKPVDDPIEKQMKELLGNYKSLKAEYNKQLESTKKENLEKKNEVLEEFRELMEGQENFEKTFRRFKELQKRWFAISIVPQQNVKDLWDSYNYFVDKFNDYVRINRDLRALDLKKNLEQKLLLCEKAEQLDEEKSVINAFKILQKYHTRWREIGPIPRENRDEVWDRFKAATAVINRKHQDHHSKLKESLHDNLAKKVELCEKAEAILYVDCKVHAVWVEKTNELLGYQKAWKSIGYAPKKDNNAIYARFRSACDKFFDAKAKFYASIYEQQQENLKLKLQIIEKAEALKESEDWKETTSELIRLQKQWKEIGPVPKRDSDRLWKRFRLACDLFFNRKSKYYEDIDSTYADNLKIKAAIIKEMDEYKVSNDQATDMAAMEAFQDKFAKAGFVPNDKKDEIKDKFREALDRLLERMEIDEHERNILKFKNRIGSILKSPRADMKIRFERDKLVNKLQQLRSDIGVWENNIGFFIQSKSSNETINGFQEKIDQARERINSLEAKIKLLDNMESEN